MDVERVQFLAGFEKLAYLRILAQVSIQKVRQ
jgi:hypothetical protein